MRVEPTYPGAYVEEIASGVRPILGVSTSIAAIVGYFHRGPLNFPVQVFNLGEFEREFGGLHRDDEAGYAIQQFFLNGGSAAWVVRVASSRNSAPAPAEVMLKDPVDATWLRAFAGRHVRGRSVEEPGTWGQSILLDVDYTLDPAVTNRFSLTVSEVHVRDGRRLVARSEIHANISADVASPDYVVERVNEASKLIQLSSEHTPALRVLPGQTGTTGGSVDRRVFFDDQSTLNVDSGNGPQAVVLAALSAPTRFTGEDRHAIRWALERAIQDAGARAFPTDLYLAGASVAMQNDRLRILAGGRTQGAFKPDTVLRFTENGQQTAAGLGLVGETVTEMVQQYALAGGCDGGLPDRDALVGRFEEKTGIYALRDVDLFNILVIPGSVTLERPGHAAEVYSAAEIFCEQERAFLLVDVPEGKDEVQEVRDWVDDSNIRHRNAAVYFPRVRIHDALNDDRLKSVGASGTMAGVYARTDGERGVWKAPAGLDAVLRNVQGLDANLTDAENDQLNPAAINALRRFPVYGLLAWGARTLDGADANASEWRYVPVRRLALFLEESLIRSLQWVVFEPNDESLWAQIRLTVAAFMHDLFGKGAFHGTGPRDAYFVKCDAETTNQTDINLGVVNVMVGFAPLKPAEFVVIRIQQMAGQVQA